MVMVLIVGVVVVLIVLVAIGGIIQGYQNSQIKRAKYEASKEYLKLKKERIKRERETENNK